MGIVLTFPFPPLIYADESPYCLLAEHPVYKVKVAVQCSIKSQVQSLTVFKKIIIY